MARSRHVSSVFRIDALEPRRLLASAASEALARLAAGDDSPARYVENLNRGVVAIRNASGNAYVGWRFLGTDDPAVSFNVYRAYGSAAPVKRNSSPLTTSTNFQDTGVSFSTDVSYFVRPILNGVEGADSERFTLPANAPVRLFLNVPLQIPAGGTTPSGETYTYSANDTSVGDLDGDGDYEFIVKWEPSNAKDNSQAGYTGNVYIDAYTLEGARLWRIDLGRNIRAGAHYTQFIVYDLDSDGKAEVAMKTAPGTIDGAGANVLMGSDSASADYRNSDGYILTGPEYLTVFNGLTGAARNTIALQPARGSVTQWGDSYGNRVDRFTAAVAYLDGEHPSLIMGRGYYGPQSSSGQARNEVAAYDFNGTNLSLRWHFKAGYNINGNINGSYIGQGAHGMSIADVDGDGKDEIVYGACVIDDNGTGLYSTGLGHGDAFHVGDFDPSRPGLEVFMVHESPSAYTSNGRNAGGEFRDARTGELIFGIPANNDVGRGVAADIDPNSPGAEMWATTTDPNGGPRYIYSAAGTPLYTTPSNMFYNFVVWWDGDLTRELLDGTTISEWNNPGRSNFDLDPGTSGTQQFAPNASSNNGTKSTPALTADVFGDWREEVIWRRSDNTALMIFTTGIVTNSRIFTLMHDTQYRVAVAWQNGAYNQPPHPSFFLGANMQTPPMPNIRLAGVDTTAPTWLGGAFDVNTASVTLTFSEDVGASIGLPDFVVVSPNGPIVPSGFSYNAATNAVTLSLPKPLTSGVYSVNAARDTITDQAGNPLANAVAFHFNFLAGDANGDGAIDFDDLLVLAQHYGTNANALFTQGDFNYDGKVDFDDLLILAQGYGTQPALTIAPAGLAVQTKRR